jgi:pyridoxamine 5'-phosphate oxidase
MSELRVNYTEVEGLLSDTSIFGANPVDLFTTWMSDAVAAKEPEPNAMCLATVSAEGRPSARFVLLKGYDESGFVWYTNYESRKAHDLASNPAAALTFWWAGLERSVRIEGDAVRVSAEESDEYFESRPPQSRLGAWVSDQSRPISGREGLEGRWSELEKMYFDDSGNVIKTIPRPPHWGGFRIVPTRMEFWKGRASRLHDRIVFERKDPSHAWCITRLQP